MITLEQLQHEVEEWSSRNFPGKKPYQPLLGAVEEIGELCHAHLKLEQGIRGEASMHRADKEDSVADVIIYLADYCTQNNINLQRVVEETWNKVKQRDWTKNSLNGVV